MTRRTGTNVLVVFTIIIILLCMTYDVYQNKIKEHNDSKFTLSLRAMKFDPKNSMTVIHKFELDKELKNKEKYKEIISVVEDPCKVNWPNSSCSNYVMIIYKQ